MKPMQQLMDMPAAGRRAAAVLLLVVALALCVSLIVVPVSYAVARQQHWREDAQRQLARERGLVQSAQVQQEFARQIEQAPMWNRFFEAGPGGQPRLQLESELRTALMRAGIESVEFKELAASEAVGVKRCAVAFAAIMTIDQLQAFLTTVAQNPRYMRVERLRIESPVNQRADENAALNLLIEVSGYSVDPALRHAQTVVALAN
jgi:hypothetical protein